MLGRNHLDISSRSSSKENNTYTNNISSQPHTNTPQRPQRKRAIPDPNGLSNLTSSVSQLSLFEDHSSMSSLAQSSLPSSPSTASLTNSFVDIKHLDSGIDIQEPPKPLNKRPNRDIRNRPTEIENPQTKPLYGKSHLQQDVSNTIVQKQSTGSGLKSKVYLSDEEDEDDDYFADILDKYCNSDEDPASPTTPYSPVSNWKGPQSPVTPTIEYRDQFNKTTVSSTKLAGTITATMRSDDSKVSSDYQHPSRSRNNSASDYNSPSASPLNAATAKFNMYNQPSPLRNSQESLARSISSSSSTHIQSEYSSKSNNTVNNPASITRAYAKKPPPPPKDDLFLTSSPQKSQPVASVSTAKPSKFSSSGSSSSIYQHSSRSHEKIHYNDSSTSSKESKPEPPPKDGTRRAYASQPNNNSSYYGNSRPPTLTLDTHTSGQSYSFSDVVEETMNRHRPSASSPNSYHSPTSGTHSYPNPDSSKRTASKHDYGHSNNTSHQSGSHPSDLYAHQNTRFDSRYDQSGKNYSNGYSRDNTDHSKKPQNSYESSPYSHQTPRKEQQHLGHDAYYSAYGSSSQPDLSRTNYKSTTNSTRSQGQTAQYPSGERSRSYSYGSIQAGSSASLNSYNGSSHNKKSALSKTPIARARAKEMYGSRKVAFGEMITIVTIERAETPPPPPPLDKKARKKLLQAKKNAAAKGKPHQSFDPEYNAAFFEGPYTPAPADVVVTLAPWIGNPNYDEEKANSKFYYDDDLEYDEDEEYDAQYESDIRLGPDDDDDDDDDEDEDEDEDDEEFEARSWGRGIAGPGGALPKKKGGMFKFKKAVNRLLRN